MLKTKAINRFKKDVKLCSKRGLDMRKLKYVVNYLENEQKLDVKYKNHTLSGRYDGSMECHIQPDWLLIYEIDEEYLYLLRTGTHSDLFN